MHTTVCDDTMKLGTLPTIETLNEKRKTLQVSKTAIADESGLSRQTVTNVLNGHRDPKYSTVRSIADALQTASVAK